MEKLIREYKDKLALMDKAIASINDQLEIVRREGNHEDKECLLDDKAKKNIRRQCYLQFIKDLEAVWKS